MGAISLNTNVASGIILAKFQAGTKILLLNRALDNFWCHVAGKIEDGETAWQAIIREIREETGITVSELYSAEFLEQFYEAKQNCITMIPVFVTFVPDTVIVELNKEHTEFKWCSIDEAKHMAPFPNQAALYDHILKYFIDSEPSDRMRIGPLVSKGDGDGLSAVPA